MRKSARISLLLILIYLAFAGFSGFNEHFELSEKVAAAKAESPFSVGQSFKGNLEALKGKAVTLMLSSGQSLSGKLSDISDNQVHLERITGKEFYDALILLDRIEAVQVRAR